jgi:hypothetical protein
MTLDGSAATVRPAVNCCKPSQTSSAARSRAHVRTCCSRRPDVRGAIAWVGRARQARAGDQTLARTDDRARRGTARRRSRRSNACTQLSGDDLVERFAEFAGMPWGSIAVLTSRQRSVPVITGPARYQKGWVLPLIGSEVRDDDAIADLQADARAMRRECVWDSPERYALRAA